MKKQVFVVEGDQHIRELLEYLLIDAKYKVKSFCNVATFNQEIKNGNPHLIILDTMLPDGDGQKVCENLKEREETQKVPVLLMSANLEKLALKGNHAQDLLPKPFHIEQLYAKIRRLIGESAVRGNFDTNLQEGHL